MTTAGASEPRSARGRLDRPAVAAHDQGRPLRREHDPDDLINAGRGELGQHRLDRRLREPHRRPDEHLAAQSSLEGRRLALRDRDERRAADHVVAAPEFGRQLGVGRAAAADPGEVVRDVVERRRRAVGHQEHAAAAHRSAPTVSAWGSRAVDSSGADSPSHSRAVVSWTKSTRRRRTSGSVPGQHAVAEVEDVARAPAGLGQHPFGASQRRLPAGERARAVEVALDAAIGPEPAPGRGQRLPPIDPLEVAARRAHQLEQAGRPRPEVDRRDGRDPLEDRADVRQDVRLVVGRPEHAHPAIEELDDLDAGVDLGAEVPHDHLGQLPHQRMPGLGLAVHERAGDRVLARRPALDQVAREGERRAGEADDGLLAVELGADQPDRLASDRRGRRLARSREGGRRPRATEWGCG